MEYYDSVIKRNKTVSFVETWIDLDSAIQSDFPHCSLGKESVCNAGDPGLIPGSGRSPGEGNSNPLPYSCLENPMDRGAWQATVHGVTRVGLNLSTSPHTEWSKSERGKQISYINAYVWNLEKLYKWAYLQSRNRDTNVENKCMDTKGEKRRWGELGGWDWHIYTAAAAAAAAKSLQSCLTLCDPIDGSPPGSPVPGILQARTLEWVAISFSNAWKWKVKGKLLSCVQLLATPWTVAHQAPLSMGFSRQECWSGVPLPSPHIYTTMYKRDNWWEPLI